MKLLAEYFQDVFHVFIPLCSYNYHKFGHYPSSCLLFKTCLVFQGVKILTLSGSLCCVDFINIIGAVAGVRRLRLVLSIAPI
jgi:hypothetical protein